MQGSRISVITATRNALSLLRENAPNLLQQLGADDEWVVQDGASDDEVEKWSEQLADPRLRFEGKPDTGIYEAFNRAVERAQGDYFLFIGSDDRIKISLDAVRGWLKDPQTIYYGDVVLEQSGRRYAGDFTAKRLAKTNICHQAIFYPKAVFANRCYDTAYPIQADWVLNMDCWHDPSLKFEYLNCIVASFNEHSGLSARRVDIAFQRDYPMILRRYFTMHDCFWPWIIHAAGNIYRNVFRRTMKVERKRSGLRI